MSRIGNKHIELPNGVTVTVVDQKIMVKGLKGELTIDAMPGVKVEQQDNEIIVSRTNDERQTRASHGLIRSLINNCIIGVTKGYRKTLKLVGTGYRVASKGTGLTLSLGFSHTVDFPAPQGIVFTLEGNDTIHIDGIDKQEVGQVAANIRKIRPPEPYRGKGIRYSDEVVRRKAGKTAA